MDILPKEKLQRKKAKNNAGKTFKNVIAGEVISSIKIEKHIFYILFVIFLIIIYIGNGYQAYTVSSENAHLEREIKELRAEFVSTQAQLIEKMKFINIQEEIKQQGLELQELKQPPYTVSSDGY